MRHATLCIVREGDKILLGMKKKGFGSGKYNGFGGKVEQNETVESAAVRELREESGLIANSVKKLAELTFKFPHKEEWNQIVHVYVTDSWMGSPVETEEMSPEWFSVDSIPYLKMWVDDEHWLPYVLAGKFVTGTFVFSQNETILEKEVFVK
jgi:mutator protein MutT